MYVCMHVCMHVARGIIHAAWTPNLSTWSLNATAEGGHISGKVFTWFKEPQEVLERKQSQKLWAYPYGSVPLTLSHYLTINSNSRRHRRAGRATGVREQFQQWRGLNNRRSRPGKVSSPLSISKILTSSTPQLKRTTGVNQ